MSTAPQWVNAGPDEGALHALLQRLSAELPVREIDQLWLFPTRRAGGIESTVVVAAAFDADDADRRTVITAHFTVTRDKKGRAQVSDRMLEHGVAPDSAVPRVVEGVLRRLGDEVGKEAPRHVELGGDADAWWSLIEELGGTRPVEPSEEPPAEPSTE